MKKIFALAVVVTLAGCAVDPVGQGYRGAGVQPTDPSQWRVVSVTPVPLGTGDKIAATSSDGSRVVYTSEPVTMTRDVYVPVPVYAPQPVYVQPQPYYYPPVSLSLGFVFGRHWSRGHGRIGGRWR